MGNFLWREISHCSDRTGMTDRMVVMVITTDRTTGTEGTGETDRTDK